MVVITSKEQKPYLLAWEKYKESAEIEVLEDCVIWRFKTEEEASTAANLFMNIGFEYVQKVRAT